MSALEKLFMIVFWGSTAYFGIIIISGIVIAIYDYYDKKCSEKNLKHFYKTGKWE